MSESPDLMALRLSTADGLGVLSISRPEFERRMAERYNLDGYAFERPGDGRTDVTFQGPKPDAQVIGRESLRPGVIGTCSFYLNQMGVGFEKDVRIMLRNWAHRVADPRVPLVFLHDTENPATPGAAAGAEPELICRRLSGLFEEPPE